MRPRFIISSYSANTATDAENLCRHRFTLASCVVYLICNVLAFLQTPAKGKSCELISEQIIFKRKDVEREKLLEMMTLPVSWDWFGRKMANKSRTKGLWGWILFEHGVDLRTKGNSRTTHYKLLLNGWYTSQAFTTFYWIVIVIVGACGWKLRLINGSDVISALRS